MATRHIHAKKLFVLSNTQAEKANLNINVAAAWGQRGLDVNATAYRMVSPTLLQK